MKESEYINNQISESQIVEQENNLLTSAIKLVRAAGFDVTRKEAKTETHHIANATETVKEVVKESATAASHFSRGLGRITLDKVSGLGSAVKESLTTVMEKGK